MGEIVSLLLFFQSYAHRSYLGIVTVGAYPWDEDDNMLDCNIVLNEFELYNVHFRTWESMTPPFISPTMGEILSLLFFYKNDIGIHWPNHFTKKPN